MIISQCILPFIFQTMATLEVQLVERSFLFRFHCFWVIKAILPQYLSLRLRTAALFAGVEGTLLPWSDPLF